MNILGSGGYGLVISKDDKALKLFYDIHDKKSMFYEAEIQEKCRNIIKGIKNKSKKYTFLGVNVPKVYDTYNYLINLDFRNIGNVSEKLSDNYLCGIAMERVFVPIVDSFEQFEQIHIGLGLHKDCNQSWICKNGVTRGFYANTEMMETILEEVPHQPEFTMENIAYTLGVVYRKLIDNHIRPFDVEITLGIKNDNLTLNMIDFGRVEYINSSKKVKVELGVKSNYDDYYFDSSYKGLVEDLYVPHINRNDKYAQDFCAGYF